MLGFPNAKINLGLNVVKKRADGYHNIETVFYPVGWKDALEVVDYNGASMHLSGLAIPGDGKDNLCLKAYHLLQADHELPPVSIVLHKIIPMGAGLGGGSSDGAFTLKLLRSKFNLDLTDDQLANYAAKLGSDCAFFIHNTPMYAYGKGDQCEPIELDLSSHTIVVAFPQIHVNTGQAYGMLTPTSPPTNIREILPSPVDQWRDQLVNDFEGPVFEMHPPIGQLKERMYTLGAQYAAMSGSGSAVFGIFAEAPEKAAFDLPQANLFISE